MKIDKENALAHIVFDNDGTMIDSLSNFFQIGIQILSTRLDREISPSELESAYVPDWIQLFKNLGVPNPEESFIQNVIDDFNVANKDYVPRIIPGTKQFIKDLHERNCGTYVWTGRDQESGMQVFKSLGLVESFIEMQFRDTSKAKPDPAGLEVMFPNTSKEKILLIGDSVVDILGANAFGIKCLIVDWFKNDNHEELLEAGASKVVTSHEDALKYIEDFYL
ncbi:MAG: HAD family hydrolase [Halobacteriovoraceae bacterium]|nr:HAD family hydrolase [Halobacteriovoraceae bacterium]